MAMNARKRNRLIIIAVAGVVISGAAGLTMYGLSDQIVFFQTPSDVESGHVAAGTRMRLGGLVKEATWTSAGTMHNFVVTDTGADLAASYNGILPDLFREGQGVVMDGTLQADGTFVADTVLAKHDENYMPREVADALKAQGYWNKGDGHMNETEATQ